MTEEMLTSLIGMYSSAITCFCFMGGDADPVEIQRLSTWIKANYPGIKTAWYSGREVLPEGFDIRVLDYIKLGPYKAELGGLKSPATNQALYRIESDGSLSKLTIS